MTAVELAKLVADMRNAQKEYFRIRSGPALEKSKQLEKRVDAAVKELLDQPQLF